MKKWLSLIISMMMVMTLVIPVYANDNELPIIGDHQNETNNETNNKSSSVQKSTSSVNKETNNVKDTSTTGNQSTGMTTTIQGTNIKSQKRTPSKVIINVTKQNTKQNVYTFQKVTVKAKGAKNFKSSNKKIASVSKKGVVKLKKSGTVKITFNKSGKKYTVTLKVIKPTLKLNVSKVTLKEGKTYTLKVKRVTPVNPVKFSVKNKKIAIVTNNGVITGKKKGTTFVYVQVNGIKKSIKVTVK